MTDLSHHQLSLGATKAEPRLPYGSSSRNGRRVHRSGALELYWTASGLRNSTATWRCGMLAFNPVFYADVIAADLPLCQKCFDLISPERKAALAVMARAHAAFQAAVKAHVLVRPKVCEDCHQRSDYKLDGHHEDYSKPLDVVWLCRSCHKRRHSKKIAA